MREGRVNAKLRQSCKAIGPAMVQCACELKKGDWVVHKMHKKGGLYHAGEEEFYTQLGRVVSSHHSTLTARTASSLRRRCPWNHFTTW